MNIGHIAGVCLSFLSSISYPPILFIGLFFLFFSIALAKILFSWLKTVSFQKKIKIVKAPHSIQELAHKHDVTDKIIIFQNLIPSAFCLGIKNPKIYISTELLNIMNKKEIESILLHEKYHLLHRDTFFLFITTFVKELFMLFPVIADLIMSHFRQREANADRYSISHGKDSDVVLSAFRKLLVNQKTNIFPMSYISLFIHADTLEHRIKLLKGRKSFVLSFRIKHILITLISSISLASFFLLSFRPVGAQQNISPSFCLKGHNCHSECSS
ncbi:M56 family metallopeptidase [Candidatus Roizmanbacteria bacterium]|nr:M56 family metallopeptidase [Candidatus Roizmanbacteria bacterium]